MSGFSNPVVNAAGTLIREVMKSINYITGVDGWAIFKNGNAEFNDGTFRGSLSLGSTVAGQPRIVIGPDVPADLQAFYAAKVPSATVVAALLWYFAYSTDYHYYAITDQDYAGIGCAASGTGVAEIYNIRSQVSPGTLWNIAESGPVELVMGDQVSGIGAVVMRMYAAGLIELNDFSSINIASISPGFTLANVAPRFLTDLQTVECTATQNVPFSVAAAVTGCSITMVPARTDPRYVVRASLDFNCTAFTVNTVSCFGLLFVNGTQFSSRGATFRPVAVNQRGTHSMEWDVGVVAGTGATQFDLYTVKSVNSNTIQTVTNQCVITVEQWEQ